MGEAKDAVAEAVARNKLLAARLLARRQELEAELAAGPTEERAASLPGELARVDVEYRSALTELAELRRLGAQAGAGEARASIAGDPALDVHEERALDAARAHVAELEAAAGLGEVERRDQARDRPLTREEADDQARAEFEALRAKRGRSTPPKKTM